MDAHALEGMIAAVHPPFSFLYDGVPSRSLLAGWRFASREAPAGGGARRRVRTWTCPASSLVVTMEEARFPGSAAVEWVMRFRNEGPSDSPVLEEVLPLDLAVPHAGPAVPSVLHSSGCWDEGSGIGNYCLHDDALRTGDSVRLINPGGGKTDFSVPFFDLRSGSVGLIGGLGWPGRYLVEIGRPRDTEVRVRAGMEELRVSLHPGEEIRTPLVLLLPWGGDLAEAHNTLRRHILTYHAPHREGEPVLLPLSHGGWGGMRTATAQGLVERIARDGIGYEVFWMDAGWYGADRPVDEFQVFNEEDWFLHAGNWRVNRIPHPGGLKPVSRAAHDRGMRFLLWFEPERAVVGTPVTREHPEWFLGEAATEFMGHRDRPHVRYRLFNFGDPAARRWMTDWVCAQVADLGIDIFRQDCNFGPADLWQAADTPKRRGVTEIRYVEGLLAFWDEVRERNPGLVLDITQRGDLETISRGVDLTRSDYPIAPESDPVGNQAATMGLAHWRPHFGTMIQTRPGDTYHFRSALCPGLSFSPFTVSGTREQLTGFDTSAFPFDWARTMAEHFRRARPYFFGDFYPLTACTLDRSQWAGWQLHRPDLGSGFVLLFRRPESRLDRGRFPLRGLGATTVYEVEDVDGHGTSRIRGGDLAAAGLVVEISAAPGSRLFFYRAT